MRLRQRRRARIAATAAMLFCAVAAAHAQTYLRTVNVANSTALSAAIAAAVPGDDIVLANGNYSGFTIAKMGAETHPIRIRAANRGQAVVNSGTIRLNSAAWVVIEGLRVTTSGGSASVGSDTRRFAVWFNSANDCRLTRCTFQLSGQNSSTYWVLLSGQSHRNRIDRCEFGPNTSGGNKYIFVCGNRPIAGVTPPADRTSWAEGNGAFNPNMARHTRVDRNHFRDKGAGTGEIIDLGGLGVVGDYQDTHSLVELNLIENCDGDAEIIAIKSSSNVVRFNTVRTSVGMLSSRAGNKNEIYGNFMLQGGKNGSGGIKLYEKDHKVYNNYIEGTDDYPLLIGSGDSYNPAVSPDNGFGHAQVFRAWVAHNTVVNCGRQVRIGHGSTDQLPPTDCVFANNLITGSGTIFSQNITPVNLIYAQNLIWPQNPNRSGFIVSNPQLAAVEGLQRPTASSPAIGAANASYFSFVTEDMDGQARDGVKDIGADEQATTDIVRRPLTTADVGPNAPEEGPATPQPLTYFFEVESLAISDKTAGLVTRVSEETPFSGGRSLMVDSTATGQFVTVTLPGIEAGAYEVRLGIKRHPSRGIMLASAGPAGGELEYFPVSDIVPIRDFYAANPDYPEIELGLWIAKGDGNQSMRFEVVGKNPASSGYTLNIDFIRLIQRTSADEAWLEMAERP